MKKYIYYFLMVLLLSALASCGGKTGNANDNDTSLYPDDITLNKTALTLNKAKEKEQLIATVFPSEVSEENKKITWQSSNEAVARVNETGLVTAVAVGHATIYAILEHDLQATCEVTVTGISTPKPQEETDDDTKKKETVFGTISVSGGTYTGYLKTGTPHGEGKMYFTKQELLKTHSIKDYPAEEGDVFVGTWNTGMIVYGKLLDKNGVEKYTILSGQ